MNVPKGSKFKGYVPFTVQGLIIKAHNIRYVLERWQTPDGKYVESKLPPTAIGHFSSDLIRYVLFQCHQCQVTQPLLLEQLHEFDIDISVGQINRILIEGHADFHQEKDDLLSTALEISPYIQVDDTNHVTVEKTASVLK